MVAEIKDDETSGHLSRVETMMEMLCVSLRKEKIYSGYLNDNYLQDLISAAYLHDIGKIGVPDKILYKKGSLTKDEFKIIKTHTAIGYEILSKAKKEIKGESIYDLAMEIARYHHERWDGSGYPCGLSGGTIPLSARMMAIIDVYDALISRRSYKEPLTHDQAMQIIKVGSGSHFDPQISSHFIEVSDTIYEKIKPRLDL